MTKLGFHIWCNFSSVTNSWTL